MDERDETVVGALERLLVYESNARGLERRERSPHVVDLETDVVDSRPALLEELPDGALRRRRLEELEKGLADRAKRREDLL